MIGTALAVLVIVGFLFVLVREAIRTWHEEQHAARDERIRRDHLDALDRIQHSRVYPDEK
jgi:hypothetical protein